MDVLGLLACKLGLFLNVEPRPQATGAVFYREDEPRLLSLAAKKRDGAVLLVSRWGDLFPTSAFERLMAAKGFTDADCYAIGLVLSRFGYMFEVDCRRRIGKDYFVFFYLVQLVGLKRGVLDADGRIRNHMLRFLLFELSIDDEAYRRFSIAGGRMLMATDVLGTVPFPDAIERVHEALRRLGGGESALLDTLKDFQVGVAKLLAAPDAAAFRFVLDDGRSELICPEAFMRAFAEERDRLMDALAATIGPDQSAENLFVSRLLLMNYGFYLSRDPRAMAALRSRFRDEASFGKLIETAAAFRPPALGN